MISNLIWIFLFYLVSLIIAFREGKKQAIDTASEIMKNAALHTKEIIEQAKEGVENAENIR